MKPTFYRFLEGFSENNDKAYMKPTSHLSGGTSVCLLALLVTLAGCAQVPTRPATPTGFAPYLFAERHLARIQMPAPMTTVRPEFPWEMKRAGLSGTVNVHCLIDESGRLQEMKVADATHVAFIKPALDALKQWTFEPALREGAPVAMVINIPLHFVLE